MKIPRYITLQKPRGQTPLQAIQAWKKEFPVFGDVPATYAGRLDPMASGKLLVLLGEECKRKEHYTGLDKEYEIEVVLDLHTDTGDALGMSSYEEKETVPPTTILSGALQSLCGTRVLPYPAFSSKTVNGKHLFEYALLGTLDTIDIPTHKETLYSVKLLKQVTLSTNELKKRVEDAISVVPTSTEASKEVGADFRQDTIRDNWQELFESLPSRRFLVLTLRVTCGTGSYMRTLAERIGESLETSGFALSIRRTIIGRYVSVGPLGFWVKKY